MNNQSQRTNNLKETENWEDKGEPTQQNSRS